MQRRELVDRDRDPRSPERGQFAFVQALIREVAYNTLSRKDRKARHLAAARYFEQLGSDELASALANHYLAAHQDATEGAEADALAAQARIALRAAAERAVALGAHDQAVMFYEQAVGVTPEKAEQAELWAKAGQAASRAARHARAEELFTNAIGLYTAVGDRTGAAAATGALGWGLLNDRHNRRALELLDGALSEYGDLWPDPAIVLLKVQLARACLQADQNERSLQLADEAIAEAERSDLVPIIASAFNAKGGALGNLGRLREGIALLQAGEELARANGLEETLLGSLVLGGFLLGEVDNAAALAKTREGMAHARRTGHRAILMVFINNFGYTGFLVGEWEAALAEMGAALAEELGLGDRIWLSSNALIVRACRGEDVSAELAELDRLAAEHGDEEMSIPILDTNANAALAAGRLQEARGYWIRATELTTTYSAMSFYQAARPALWEGRLDQVTADLAAIDATGIHGRVIDVRRTTVRAGIAALEGRTAEAVAGYREAIRAWHELGMTWDEALTGLDMATVLDPSDPHVRAVAQSTREILVRLGAQPFIERLDSAMAREATPLAAPARSEQGILAGGEPA
jgi:tetratricopeptide (TPR) repeat protein